MRDYLHMVLHCVFRHNFVNTLLDLNCWDLACDMAVEAIINELNLQSTASVRRHRQASLLEQVQSEVAP